MEFYPVCYRKWQLLDFPGYWAWLMVLSDNVRCCRGGELFLYQTNSLPKGEFKYFYAKCSQVMVLRVWKWVYLIELHIHVYTIVSATMPLQHRYWGESCIPFASSADSHYNRLNTKKQTKKRPLWTLMTKVPNTRCYIILNLWKYKLIDFPTNICVLISCSIFHWIKAI